MAYPYFALAVHVRERIPYVDNSNDPSVQYYNTYPGKDLFGAGGFKKNDVGLGAGAQFSFKDFIVLTFEYQHGLTDIQEFELTTIKNRSFGVTLGYGIK
jgi:hypothetical protein